MIEEFRVSGDAKPILNDTPPVLLILSKIIARRNKWIAFLWFTIDLPI